LREQSPQIATCRSPKALEGVQHDELERHVLQIIGSRQAIVVRLDGHALVENVVLGGYNERPGGCREGKLSASIRTHQLLVAM
jgi:hypothetical protein